VVTGSESVELVAGEEVLKESSSKANHVEEGKEGGVEQSDQEEDEDDNKVDDSEYDNKVDDSEYAPGGDGLDGTVNPAGDADNLPDKVKPGPSLFDLLILPIAKTLLVKKGKKGKQVHDGDDESPIMLSEEDAPLKKAKGKSVTKLPAEGSGNKVVSKSSSNDVLLMMKGAQEEFFNLPWKDHVSVYVPSTYLFL
jgi:hypothetical protein